MRLSAALTRVLAAACSVAFTAIRTADCAEVIPERPGITYLNPLYVEYATFTIHRGSRKAAYSCDLKGRITHSWGNNVTVDLIFYEFLSNEYKRSFIELHYKICDVVTKDKWLGPIIRKTRLNDLPCPYHAGNHELLNMSVVITDFADSFPFKKFRVDAEFWLTDRSAKLASGHVHFNFKKTFIRKASEKNGKV